MRYKCINFEGLDQVGKGDAVKNLSLKISELGYSTCVISFPYYATPLGFLIRDILVNGLPNSMKTSKGREVELKMLLFALNRLEILNCILSDKKYDVYVFDRGPFSCALTIGYHISKYAGDCNKGDLFTKKGLYFDSYFRKILNVDNCVIYIKHKDIEWSGSRQKDGDDMYEKNEVQRISANIYSIFEKKIGEGWSNVVTKDRNGWKSRKDIREECLSIVRKSNVIEEKKKGEMKGGLKYLGIDEIQRFLYAGSRVSKVFKEDWMSAIQSNDKKEVYRVSELVSRALVESTGAINWCDREMIVFINKIMKEYPEVFDVIYYKYDKEFVDKLKQSIL